MIPDDLLNLDLPEGKQPEVPQRTATPEENDQWQMDNARLRSARGDNTRSATPVNVMFAIEG